MTDQAVISRFRQALEKVYGPLNNISPEEAARWVPPENPGAGGHRGRYLWTDAFGVVDLLTLYKETSSLVYLELAKALVRTVHDVLGRTRDGYTRLPGATDEAPLGGGLRIGKIDATGSDGDGQYHHYLTLWMFALNRLSLAAKEERYNDLAIQLARAIHPHFVFKGQLGRLRMVWKISTDMKHVLVGSEGHLDAATGFVIYRLLQQTAVHFRQEEDAEVLGKEIEDYRELMSRPGKLSASSDLLDLGMCLWMCHFCRDESWAATLGEESLQEARKLLGSNSSIMARPASRRLAFREFGACLGIDCFNGDGTLRGYVRQLIKFWEECLEVSTDEELRPISWVMYAAALVPGAS